MILFSPPKQFDSTMSNDFVLRLDFLCPLKHPSELPNHPSLSHAYTSKALFNMTQAIDAKLRQERALLWRARNLHRQFLGDGSWVPCGTIETSEDRSIFEPRMASTGHSTPLAQGQENGASIPSAATGPHVQNHEPAKPRSTEQPDQDGEVQAADNDVDMTDAHNEESQSDAPKENAEPGKVPKAEEVDTPVGDLPQHPETTVPGQQSNGNCTGNPQSEQDRASDSDHTLERERKENGIDKPTTSVEGGSADRGTWVDAQGNGIDGGEEMHDETEPGQPRRMTTRAQASAVNPQQDPDPNNLSPSPSSDTLNTLPTPHPLFLTPHSVRPDPNFGLPPNEAEDTRRLLWSYVQKQEETVRGFEHMLESLLRACRMKDDVLEWCKAEGHVGEMSDGEDWYDREKWGLAEGEDLKKGADEDEIETVEESRTTNKRGRGRRA